MVASMPPTRSIYASPEAFESSFRILAIISWEGGQSVSHVLQWNTSAPDFSSASNSSWLNLTVWSWSFGQTISNFIRSLMSLPSRGQIDIWKQRVTVPYGGNRQV